jgi:RNA polymerase sigma-70 factor (ECF subfamily)
MASVSTKSAGIGLGLLTRVLSYVAFFVLVALVTDSAILSTGIPTSFAHQHNDACENSRPTFGLRQSRMTDFVLVKVAQGNARAVRECIDQFGSLIWSIARRLTRTRADAEDAVQEIFTDIWRSAGRFDPAQGSEKVFVATIARRRLIDRLRRVSHRDLTDSIDDVESLTWSDPGTRAEVCAEAQTAARAVMQLRPEQRQVLELGLLQGLSHSEISEALKMPLGTVKTMMRRGLIQVRHLMGVSGDVATEEAQS